MLTKYLPSWRMRRCRLPRCGGVRPLWRLLVRALPSAGAGADWDVGAISVSELTSRSRRLWPPPLKNSASSPQLVHWTVDSNNDAQNCWIEHWRTEPGVVNKKGVGGVRDLRTLRIRYIPWRESRGGTWHDGVSELFWGGSEVTLGRKGLVQGYPLLNCILAPMNTDELIFLPCFASRSALICSLFFVFVEMLLMKYWRYLSLFLHVRKTDRLSYA